MQANKKPVQIIPTINPINNISENQVKVNQLLESISKNPSININPQERLRLYHSYIKQLSFICGWDAPPEHYDQQLYNQTVRQIAKKF